MEQWIWVFLGTGSLLSELTLHSCKFQIGIQRWPLMVLWRPRRIARRNLQRNQPRRLGRTVSNNEWNRLLKTWAELHTCLTYKSRESARRFAGEPGPTRTSCLWTPSSTRSEH